MARSLAYDPRHALNAIFPYFTMFPLEYPLAVLNRYRKSEAIVMDPFCGRGTTLYAARFLGLKAQGVDSSPIAIAIARAKLCAATASSALSLAETMLGHKRRVTIPKTEFFRTAFHPDTLTEICIIRRALLALQRDSEASVLLRAAMLGCLHGPLRRSAAYFSNQMPRTFASKPDYSLAFWNKHQLLAPNVRVLEVLNRKLSKIDPMPLPYRASFRDVWQGDSQKLSSVPAARRNFSIVVTSPPYFGMRTYVEDQWLRSWFLGGPPAVVYGKSTQVSHAGLESFAQALGRVWRNMASTSAPTLEMYIRFGTIQSAGADARGLLARSLELSGVNWMTRSVKSARSADSGRRQAAQMSPSSKASTEFDFHIIRKKAA